jgi:hypothetical protein
MSAEQHTAASEVPGLAREVPPEAWQHVDCGLCGSAERQLKFRDGPFSVVTCKQCSLTYVTPRLTDAALLSEVYDEGYWSSSAAKDRGYTDYRSDAPLYRKTYQRRIKVVRRHFARPGRVLDVGCAAGYFLEVMQEEGWDVTGLEPSDAIRREAEQRLGPEHVIAGLLGQVELEPAMKAERITREEILAAVRASGTARLDAVAAVVLETDGTLSVVGRPAGDGASDALDSVARVSGDRAGPLASTATPRRDR